MDETQVKNILFGTIPPFSFQICVCVSAAGDESDLRKFQLGNLHLIRDEINKSNNYEYLWSV